MQAYIDTRTVSLLTGEAPQRIREKVAEGTYSATRLQGRRGGSGGESYQVLVSSLPPEAQILYINQHGGLSGPVTGGGDLTAYRERYGAEGIRELLERLWAVQAGQAIRTLDAADKVAQLTALAVEHGTTLRTLYRWMDAYEASGLRGIMRALNRKDKGKPLSICPAAYAYSYGLYMNQVKRKQSTIYQKLVDWAARMGPQACTKCQFNPESPVHAALRETGKINQYPPCTDPDKRGVKVPACRQTLGRILSAIPADEQGLARRGKKYFKDTYMLMGIREKPEVVNEVWFGDHHQFDCFVLDETGKPVRPWLTAWYDGASGCLVGWLLCKKPNSHTIIAAFNNAVTHTLHSPFHGLPGMVYVDNGKDYRGKLFETGQIKDLDLGRLNSSIDTCSVLQLFRIGVTHALPYQGWSKPVERFFGTLENIWIREVPGWCGDSPEERPEDFSRQLRLQLERGQLWTMDQLYEYLRDTAFPAYHNRPHEGYGGKTPLELYNTLPHARMDEPSFEMLGVLRNDKTTRQIHQQGVRFKKEWYWDDAMIGLAGKGVTVLYDPDDLSTITVVMDGRTLCEAAVAERLQMVGEDPEVVAAHMEKQKRQIRDTAERVRRASRCIFADEVDVKRSRGNLTALEYEKAARARIQKREEEQQARQDAQQAADAMSRKLIAMGEQLIRNAQ